MPYSVVVAEQADGSIAVSVGQASALFKAMERDNIDGFAEMVRRPRQAAMDALLPPPSPGGASRPKRPTSSTSRSLDPRRAPLSTRHPL